MGHRKEASIIQSGIVLMKEKIARHTFHIKVQSQDFSQMQYVPGFTAQFFLGNPHYDIDCEDRKYSFWNYEPVHQIADFAICTFSNGKGADWIKSVQPGDIVYFEQPRGKLLVDNSADNYVLIGDITSLSHLYEINRGLAISKNIRSFVYTESNEDIFPDIDHSFPFEYHIINPVSEKAILEKVKRIFPAGFENTMVYTVGHPATCITIHHYLKNECNAPLHHLRTKPFWK
ncbi:SIP domain-containing protein [Chitinophaga flava]|uniref:FAD-binding FR-type domain-containing protein n=1 Tax=Chitinophaga flava TaxID=2259036 RepID=A0A365XW94_9BACT|nr:hypothetical protein [Chitinophaga flava]RBL89865.1 hypothetical protein DF182_25625 [Chitinophaga flava]